MIRGRHRGLPVAIDRAIVLPQEYNKKGDEYTPDLRPNDPELGTNPVEEQPVKQYENGNSGLAMESTLRDPEKYQRRISIA